MRITRIILTALFILLFYAAVAALAKQTQPDGKRVKEIQSALVKHGYPAGKSWPETQNILRGIAREHHWQTQHAPDARVLILLDLGNKYSDPEVTVAPRNHLDGASR
jgi:hypothetical protein